MDDYEKQSLELVDKLTIADTGDIKSIFGVVNLVYAISDNILKRNVKKPSPEFKKELSLKILKTLTSKLKEKNLINDIIANEILNNDNLEIFINFIEDIIEFWESDIFKGCLCCKKKVIKKDNLKAIKLDT
jgi:hypothetical protein